MKRIPKGQSKIEIPGKPAIYGSQDEYKQTTTQYLLDITILKQTHIIQLFHVLPGNRPEYFSQGSEISAMFYCPRPTTEGNITFS